MWSVRLNPYLAVVCLCSLIGVIIGCNYDEDEVKYRTLDNGTGETLVVPVWPSPGKSSGNLTLVSHVELVDGCLRLDGNGSVIVWPEEYEIYFEDDGFRVFEDFEERTIAARPGWQVAFDGEREDDIPDVAELPEGCRDGPFFFVHFTDYVGTI